MLFFGNTEVKTELLLKGGVVMMFEYPLYVISLSLNFWILNKSLVKFGQRWARLFDTELWPG